MPDTHDDARLELERDKLEIERLKLKLETTKAKWAISSIAVPIAVATATIVWGVMASQTQARQALRLEAMKTIMSTDIFDMQVARGDFLREFFTAELGDDFLKELIKYKTSDGGNVLAKVRFLETVASRGLSPEEVAKLVQILFPKDTWASQADVLAVLSEASRRQTAK